MMDEDTRQALHCTMTMVSMDGGSMVSDTSRLPPLPTQATFILGVGVHGALCYSGVS